MTPRASLLVAASGSAHEKLVKNSGGLVSRETEWRRGRHTTRRLPVWSATTMLRPPARACSAAVGARQVNDHGLLRVSERRRRHTFLSIQRLRCHCHNIGRLRGCRGEADALCCCEHKGRCEVPASRRCETRAVRATHAARRSRRCCTRRRASTARPARRRQRGDWQALGQGPP